LSKATHLVIEVILNLKEKGGQMLVNLNDVLIPAKKKKYAVKIDSSIKDER